MQDVDTVFFGPFIGELGWACSRWHAYCRFRRLTEFRNLQSIAMDYDWRYPLYSDFIDEFIPLPSWVTELGWEQDCYELVPPDADPGSITPQEIYGKLILECQQYYNPETTYTVRPPRGCNFFIQHHCKQMWSQLEPSEQAQVYVDSLLSNVNKDIILVSARGRERAPHRNVPESVWDKLVDYLIQFGFMVIITGTKNGSFLVNKTGRNIINMIPKTGVDGLDILIALLHKAKFSVTSQSGPTHISVLCETPAYMVGHEARRHSVDENWLNIPAMFREVPQGVYAAITAEMMLEDILKFNQQLSASQQAIDIAYSACYNEDRNIMRQLMYEEDINLIKVDVDNIRQEIINGE